MRLEISQNSTKAGAYDCNLSRDGELFCDQYMHAYDITWNGLKDKARNEHIKDLYRNDKDFQEMIK